VGMPAGWAMFEQDDAAPIRGASKSKKRAMPRGAFSSGLGGLTTPPPMAAPSMSRAHAPPKAHARPRAEAYEMDDAPAVPAEVAMDFLEMEQERAAPPPPHGKGRADDLGALFARQLASGLWDDASLGPASELRTHQATFAVLRRLLVEGVDTSHPLYGAPLKKALETLAVVTVADAGLAERLLGLALLLASGARTRSLLLVAIRRAGLYRLTGELADPAALRAWALALP